MTSVPLLRLTLTLLIALCMCSSMGTAQDDDRPVPESPASEPETPDDRPLPAATPAAEVASDDEYRPSDVLEPEEVAHLNRRPIPEGKVTFGFDDVGIDEIIPWIAKMTGKIVMPLGLEGSGIGIGASGGKITVIVDEPIEKREALEMVFSALRMNKIAVIERPKLIVLTKLDITAITDEMSDIPVLDSAVDVRDRLDRGTIVLKIFSVERTDAGEIADKLSDMKPQYAEVWVDEMSNQIIALGDIGLMQQYGKIIRELDQKWINRTLHTFRLKWADANEISTNILDMFEAGSATTSSRQTNTRTNNQRTSGTSNRGSSSSTTDSGAELRLTVSVQQNSVTVQCDPEVMEEIATLITTQWDVPRAPGTSRLFPLKYTDPLKVKSLLDEVLGEGTSTAGGGRGGNQNAQRSNATQAISGIYSIEAYPDKNALLVLAKTVESFDFIESMIDEIDQISSVGVPKVIPLKYARAVELAEELNVLLSKPGANVTIPRPESGLSGEGFESVDGASSATGGASGSQDLSFPWQRGSESDDQSPESSLIGKVRIVPIVRQNALAILAPQAYIEPMADLIHKFDIPRRQVLLSATVVEVDITDQWNFGAKWGSNPQASSNVNGQFFGGGLGDVAGAAGTGFTYGMTDFLDSLFGKGSTTSTMNISSFDVRVIIEALAQVTNTRIIQEPRVFTADNEEAVFFSGKEVPVPVSNTTDLSGGNSLNTQIEYRDVGVFLNVRPRITQEGTVDLEISLQLSNTLGSVTVGQTQGEVFSRKQVNSHVIVLDGQTVILGGLLKETETQIRQKIPILGDIPILGELFKYNDEGVERSELLAFITPTVVHRPSDNYSNYNSDDLIRLEEVAQPLADQIVGKSWLSDGEMKLDISERIIGGTNDDQNAWNTVEHGGVIPPDQDAVQTEIDSIPVDLDDLEDINDTKKTQKP